MKLLNEFLGFVVLTGPLWLVLILIPVSVWITIKVARRFKAGAARVAVGLLVFFLVMVLSFADEIAGRVYLNYLCATEAGVKVYQKVELPAAYWDEEGRRRFKLYEGSNHKAVFVIGTTRREDARFKYSMFVESYSSAVHLDKTGFRLQESESGKVLGQVSRFMYWGGWVRRNFSPHNAATSCEIRNLDEWKYEIFRPTDSQ